MTFSPTRVVPALALLAACPASAHPGHGSDPGSWLHLLAEPEHAFVWMVLGVVTAGLVSARRVRRARASGRREAGRD